MKKKVHTKVVLGEDGQERTVILEDTHIKTDSGGHEPEELNRQVAAIMDDFLDKRGDFADGAT